MNAPVKAAWLTLLLGACVARVDLGVPIPEDAGVGDLGPADAPPGEPVADAGPPDEFLPDVVPHECGVLDHPSCDARDDCDWYGGLDGLCGPAGPCDEHLEHRACVTDPACDWNGEAAGYCEPTHPDPTPCSDLYFLHCHETPGCFWEGTEFGECYGVPFPRECGGLEEAACRERPHCAWYGDAPGFCDHRVPCAGLDYEPCISSSSCDWGGVPEGFCRPTDGEPGGCTEVPLEAACIDLGCVWAGDSGECGGDPDMPPTCEGLGEVDCREIPLCDWYGGVDGAFCDAAGVCDELEGHGECILREGCDWEGDEAGFCRPTAVAPHPCSSLGFHHCRLEDLCAWEGGDFGECGPV
jgi:hypothetical protein